jgi:hypothetical protein
MKVCIHTREHTHGFHISLARRIIRYKINDDLERFLAKKKLLILSHTSHISESARELSADYNANINTGNGLN